MLDEIEGTTTRINAQSKAIQNEARQSIKLLGNIDNDMESAGSDLRQEALHGKFNHIITVLSHLLAC